MKKSIFTPSILALFIASTAHAGAKFTTDSGTLTVGADIRYSVGSETNRNTLADSGNAVSDGRVILKINGEKVLENNNFVAFSLNPAWKQYGEPKPYDMYLQFGVKKDWNIKVGRQKAINLSPNDTSSSDQDSYVYIPISKTMVYRADIARGRLSSTGDDGQYTFTKVVNKTTQFQLAVQSLDKGATIIARPVVTHNFEKGSIAVGLEAPIMSSDEVGTETFMTANDNFYNDITKNQIVDDGSAWIGTGITGTYKMTNDLQIVARAAYLIDDRIKSNKATSYAAGLGARYKNFYLGAIHGVRNTEIDANDTEEWDVYSYYEFPNILTIENFNIFLGAGYSSSKVNKVSQSDIIGSKVTLKYTF
ncbi:carbohydrate porin [Marinomonas flavescens]|uniref:carbohydrate porin n=1 Tax=Marinomonas flavescens TaxID=2529379 RepID=UPI0010553A8E|nr:carbohydrate porin [Marinomonas flavescens]